MIELPAPEPETEKKFRKKRNLCVDKLHKFDAKKETDQMRLNRIYNILCE